MNNLNWKSFFEIAINTLGEGEFSINNSASWCSWTTYSRLMNGDAGYWQAGLPKTIELGENGTLDGGVWLNPTPYEDLAHMIIPKNFVTDLLEVKTQNIEQLAIELTKVNIEFNLLDGLLEIKLY